MVLLIAANGFFVAAEFALVAIDRAKLEQLAAGGSRRATIALGVVKRLSFHLSGAQLGVTIMSLMLGFIAEPTIVRVLRAPVSDIVGTNAGQTVSVIIALALATTGSMVLGELIPKGLVLARPVRATLYLASPLRVFSLIFGPLIKLANRAANAIIRLFGVEPREELTAARSVEELRALVQASGAGGGLEAEEVTLLTRALRFASKCAEDVMVPRRDMVWLAREATVSDLTRLAIETGHSRFPVIGRGADEVVGVVPVKAMFRLDPEARRAATVDTLMSPILAVPEDRPLRDLLDDLQRRKAHIAVVLDEYGSTSGIVTVEDVLEEIVGEIADETDPPQVSVTVPGPDGSMILSGALRPDEVFDAVAFTIPDGPYSTLAGFVIDRLGRIPEPGDSFEENTWTFQVAEIDRHRVAAVRVHGPSSDRDAQ